MNNVTVNENILLEDLNDNKATMMFPAIVYLVVLMLVGLGGNILVFFFYGMKSKQSTNNTFILCVAMYDLILCTLSIPIEIVDIRFSYNFPYPYACKIMRFFNYFAAIGSVFTLIIIAVDRHRRICRPFKNRFQQKHARIACGLSIPFSLLLSWPAAVLNTSVPVEISLNDGINLTGFDCTTTNEASYQIYLLVYNGFFLLGFIVSTIIIFTMYALVGKAILKHQKSQVQHIRRELAIGSQNSSQFKSRNVKKGGQSHTADDTTSATGSDDKTNRISIKAKDHVSVKTIKFTMVMFVITLVFIISFLPHIALALWRSFQGGYEGEALDGANLVAFQIGVRSYFLNSAINPLIYGFFNSKYRAFFKKRLCSCCNKFTDHYSTSSSSGTTQVTRRIQMHSLTSNSNGITSNFADVDTIRR